MLDLNDDLCDYVLGEKAINFVGVQKLGQKFLQVVPQIDGHWEANLEPIPMYPQAQE